MVGDRGLAVSSAPLAGDQDLHASWWGSPSLAAENCPDHRRNLTRDQWRHGIANLHELLCPVAQEYVVVREGLDSGCLTNCKASALARVPVDESVTVLGEMTGDGVRRILLDLYPEAIGEVTTVPIRMIGGK